MKAHRLLPVLLLALTGCFSIREIAQVQGPSRPDMTLYDRSLLAGFDLNRERIDTSSSFIESPAGRRYTLEVQPHQFDIEQRRSYVSALLYPVAADGSRLQGWRNGIWSFHFVVETNGTTHVIDQKWKYYSWLYCPLIHGAPN
jgi:hypothetical protein